MGCVLNREVELSQEMAIFLQEAGHPKAVDFKDKIFLLILPCLADIFGHLNALNVLLEGKNTNLIFCCEKIQHFEEKLSLWKERVLNGGNMENFFLEDKRV